MTDKVSFEFEKVKQICEKLCIPMSHIVVLTVQKNWTTDFFSVVVDFDTKTIIPLFGAEISSGYKEMKFGDFNIEYQTDLLSSGAENKSVDPSKHLVNLGTSSPFCCQSIQPYKNRYLDQESHFQNFMKGNGSSNYVFEVKRQVNNGPLLGL